MLYMFQAVPPPIIRSLKTVYNLCNAASCWLYLEIYLWCTDPWTSNLIFKQRWWTWLALLMAGLVLTNWSLTTQYTHDQVNICISSQLQGPELCSQYSGLLQAGVYRLWTLVGRRFFLTPPDWPWGNPGSCRMDTGSFLSVNSHGMASTNHPPPSSIEVKKE
jgi:hypothetical protein